MCCILPCADPLQTSDSATSCLNAHAVQWSLADLQSTGDTRSAGRGSALGHVASPASTASIDRHSPGKRLWKGRREIAILLPIPIRCLWISACSCRCRCCSCCCSRMHGHGASTPAPIWSHVHAVPHEHAWRWVANVWSARGALQTHFFTVHGWSNRGSCTHETAKFGVVCSVHWPVLQHIIHCCFRREKISHEPPEREVLCPRTV